MKITVLIALLVVSGPKVSPAQSTSVLGSINCGGNQSTCFSQIQATSGAVRCTCMANCLSPRCITGSVGSTRGMQWGSYVTGGKNCYFTLTGAAKGGTTTTSNPSTTTAVYTQVTVSGIYISPLRSSKQVVDCFNGTVTNETLIFGLCG